MNRLPREKRCLVLSMLVEGSSMRSTARTAGVAFNTVKKLLIDAGEACQAYHDATVRGVRARQIQCDEAWAFCYAKDKNLETATAAPPEAGSIWTWTALDPDSKLIVSYDVGTRDADTAGGFMEDLAGRLEGRFQLTTDGHLPYLDAVEKAFGSRVDYAMLVKMFGEGGNAVRGRDSAPRCTSALKTRVGGHPDPDAVSTSKVERHNLSLRMGMRRFTRKTNGFSKKFRHHCLMVSLFMVYYNFCRVHQTIRVTPAMEAGLTDTLHDIGWLADMVEAAQPKPNRPAHYRKRAA